MAEEKTFKEQWLEEAEANGAPLEEWLKVPIVDEEHMNETMSIPGVKYNVNPLASNNATPVQFVQLHLSSLFSKINQMLTAVTNAISDFTSIKTQTTQAKEAAEQATANAQTAISGAETVDATVSGTVVTVTDRHGVNRTINVGFDIYRTYSSVAEMKADAENVPESKLVMIATVDPTDPDNAQLWGRTAYPSSDSLNNFRFLSDLDQASSAAWAEWLNNMKPEIEQAIEKAQQQEERADNALDDYQALYDRVSQQGNTAEQKGANAQAIRDAVNLWFNGQSNNGFKHDAETLFAEAQAFDTAVRKSWAEFYTNGVVPEWNDFWRDVLANWQRWIEEEASRKGILCLDFDYDYDNGELIMEYVERDTLSRDMFDYADGDLIIDYNIN